MGRKGLPQLCVWLEDCPQDTAVLSGWAAIFIFSLLDKPVAVKFGLSPIELLQNIWVEFLCKLLNPLYKHQEMRPGWFLPI